MGRRRRLARNDRCAVTVERRRIVRRKKRRDMAVRPHTEISDIERKQGRQFDVRVRHGIGQPPAMMPERMKRRRRRTALQKSPPDQPRIALPIVLRHAAVIDQRDIDPRPVDRRGGQQRQHRLGRAAAGKCQRGTRLRFKDICDGGGERIGQCRRTFAGRRVVVPDQRFQRRMPSGMSMCRHIPFRSAIRPSATTWAESTSDVKSQ